MASGTATSPSASDDPGLPPFVVVGNPGTLRVGLFQAALRALALPPARVAPYADLLAGRLELGEVVSPGAVVRIESPPARPTG